MDGDAADPLLLGQRVVAILETGQRDATYKLATLMALIEHCIENLPERSDNPFRVAIPTWRTACWRSTGNRSVRSRGMTWLNDVPDQNHELFSPPRNFAQQAVSGTAVCRWRWRSCGSRMLTKRRLTGS